MTEACDYDFDLEEIYARAEAAEMVREALLKVPDRQRLIIARSFGIACEEESLSDIAESMERSRTTVTALKNRGLRKMRQLLDVAFRSDMERLQEALDKMAARRRVVEAMLVDQRRKAKVAAEENRAWKKKYTEAELRYREQRKANPDFAKTESGHRIVVVRGVQAIGFMSIEVQGCRNEILDEDSWTTHFLLPGDLFVDEVTGEVVSEDQRLVALKIKERNVKYG